MSARDETSVGQDASMFERLTAERDGSNIFPALLRRWWIIALVGLVGAAAAYVLSKNEQKQYTATSELLFLNQDLGQELLNSQIFQNVDPNRQAATNQALVESPTVGRSVARQLGMSYSRIAAEVSFGSDAQSDVLDVNVTDPSPQTAAQIANSYVQNYIAFRKSAAVGQINTAEALINSKLAAIPPSELGTSVAQKLISDRNTLELLKSAQTGNAQVVLVAQPPTAPSAPSPKKDSLVGLLIGLLLGCGLVVVLERRDRRIKTVEEIEELYSAPVIGTVPESNHLRDGQPGAPREEEAFMMIRAQLRYFGVERSINRVMITSAQSGEGKTLVSLNLARAAARADGSRALLIETDMRRPSLTRLLGHESVAGLSELLTREDLESGLRELVMTPEEVSLVERPGRLDVLLAGTIPPNPVELLESKRMVELLDLADSIYDIVILDTPPIGVVSDAIPLVRRVDGVVVISRVGVSRRDHATRLMKRVRGLGANVLGIVANGLKGSPEGYYEYYTYKQGEVESPRRRLARHRASR